MINIIVTGIGAPGGTSIVKHLKNNIECKIIGLDSSIEYCAAKYYVDSYFQIPKANDELFLSTISNLIKNNNVTHLISLVTDELHIFSQNKKLLNELNCKIYISSYESILKSSNKYELYETLKNNIYLPKYKKINLRGIKSHLDEFDFPNKEICFKPLNFDGARGFRILSNKIDRLNQIMTDKPYNCYLNIDELDALLKSSNFDIEILLSEFLPGKEYTVDTFVENKKIKSFCIRERLKLKDHISFVGKTIYNELIERQIFVINEMFDFDGSIGYQFKENVDGTPLLLECNPRLQGASILSSKNNFDYILANVGMHKQHTYNNIYMYRYFDEIFESDGKLYK